MQTKLPSELDRAGRVERTIVLGLMLYFVWNCLYFFPYVVDDAFISLRYAQNLVDGNGLVYNPGERVEGFSNFSWVMLEALLLRSGLPALAALKWIGIGCGLTTIGLTFALARRLFGGREHLRWAAPFAAGFVALNTSLAVWTQGGLEAPLLALLIAAMCLRYEIELSRERAMPWSAVLLALAWMTRPEVPV